MGTTVRELLERIGSDELTEWFAFYNLSPFGDDRGDLQSAIVASTVYNMLKGKGHSMGLSDFLPVFDEQEAPRQTTEQMKAVVAKFKSAMGKRKAAANGGNGRQTEHTGPG